MARPPRYSGFGFSRADLVAAGLKIRVVSLLVPIVPRFLMRRVPYGNAAVPIISSFVQKQGNGSLEELALRLARKCTPSPDSPGIPTLLGRWAGKYFPGGR